MNFNILNIKERSCLLISLSLLVTACYDDLFVPDGEAGIHNYYISFNDIQVAIDTAGRFMLCSVDSQYLKGWKVQVFSDPLKIETIDDRPISEDDEFYFENIDFNRIYPVKLKRSDGSQTEYDLQFTPFPVFQIYVEDSIPDEPKVPSRVIISQGNADEKMITGYMGIEERGRFASYQPKKSFGIEFWDDIYETGHRDVSFFGLMPDDDWILNAMYIDRGRMREALSYKLWSDLQKDRMPELQVRKTGVEGGYAEVFLKTRYQGLYHLGERVDRKRLGISRTGEQVEGVIYKSEIWHETTEYEGLTERTSGLIWGGWELKYPKDRGDAAWDALYEYLDFAIYASDEDFKTWIFSRIDKGSVIDYFIFINIIKAVDNYGKNIIMTKHDKTSSFLMIPWDLDATWGRRWDSYCVSAVSILTNRFYERLFTLDPEGFTESLKLRWNEVRNTLVDEETIFGKIAQYKTVLVLSGAIDRENKVWPSHPLNLYWEEYEMQQWYSTRLLYLDNYFQDL